MWQALSNTAARDRPICYATISGLNAWLRSAGICASNQQAASILQVRKTGLAIATGPARQKRSLLYWNHLNLLHLQSPEILA